jgi:TetR/AcrR family transcriptional repressor of mexJK operon
MARTIAAKPEMVDDEGGTRSGKKRRAILDAATEVFLRSGYLGTNMDEIAALSGVSKQTIYKHFTSKEGLFVEIVSSMTDDAGDTVRTETADQTRREAELRTAAELEAFLVDYAQTQLSVVLTPRIMQLRRLVIGEVSRFPELAKVLYARGPKRAIGILAAMFARLSKAGLLTFDDAATAASHFNWLVMSHSLNEAMLLGDSAIPKPAELKRQAINGVRVFLAAYGKR